eukprot:SAG31_NODE_43472_length_267_cov_0.607143_1_plen_22_part_10
MADDSVCWVNQLFVGIVPFAIN